MLTQMNFYHNKKVKVSIENVSKTYKDIEVLIYFDCKIDKEN